MKRARLISTACLALSGCATAPPPPAPPATVWIGGDPAHLVVDKADCQHTADQTDVNESAGYSDSRMGVTTAMAAAVGRDNPLSDQQANVRAAVFVTCMNEKGWKAQ